jgi:hypothetical protein
MLAVIGHAAYTSSVAEKERHANDHNIAPGIVQVVTDKDLDNDGTLETIFKIAGAEYLLREVGRKLTLVQYNN